MVNSTRVPQATAHNDCSCGTSVAAKMTRPGEKRSITSLMLQEWTWRVGSEAAAHRMATSRWTVRIWVAGVLAFVLVLVGAKESVPTISIMGGIVYAGASYCIFRAWVEMLRTRRAISRSLGISIRFRSNPPPPNRKAHYIAWCKKYGVQPYPFRKPNGVEFAQRTSENLAQDIRRRDES